MAVFSSNYELYGDISQRVMESLRHFCPDMEVYSIDEAFLKLDAFSHRDLNEYAGHIRQKIKMWTGIPISIGIGPTKTLAKLANYMAKRQTQTGVYDLRHPILREQVFSELTVEKIWGIGSRLAARLNQLGITQIQQLAAADPKFIRNHFGVVGERIVLELNGVACFNFETIKPRKTIIASRSFGQTLYDLPALEEAISHHTARACCRLREQQSQAQAVYVFLTAKYTQGVMRGFSEPTSDTRLIIQVAKDQLKKLYRRGQAYKKCGVMLINISQNDQQQGDLFLKNIRSDKLMELIDRINEELGKDTIFIAAEGTGRSWKMRSSQKSPCYTTRWNELVNI